MHLVERLPPGSHDRAAFGGLQDSTPRAALFALHARMQQIHPDAWEDPLLVQIWFRMADYVVPRRDVGVFTIGALPRDPERRAALHDVADRVLRVLDGEPRSSREVATAMPELDAARNGPAAAAQCHRQGQHPLGHSHYHGRTCGPVRIDEEDRGANSLGASCTGSGRQTLPSSRGGQESTDPTPKPPAERSDASWCRSRRPA